MAINPDASYSELMRLWNAGHQTQVISALAADHAGLTALFIAQGIADGLLRSTDVNKIANLLIEYRVTAVREIV